MMPHPYRDLPDYCFWRRAVSAVLASEVDPVLATKFTIRRSDRIATAGSCFAQHISRHLETSGYNFFVTETLNQFIAPHFARSYNYGVFSARYGNIYTARQFIQLLHRAYGLFVPVDDAWITQNGRAFDPYRPQIQPNGFSSLRELQADRVQHLAAVRRAVEQADVFVFTLGLTETWECVDDGAVYPICPGVAGGIFDPARHRFVNFRMQQVLDDMITAFEIIRQRNRNIRFIVTVSPVPLVATAEHQHVLVSTTYSKSVLRAVCGELDQQFEDVAYFPSYEDITGNFSRGAYFQPDLREVTDSGVQHVMRLFMRHYAGAKEIDEAGDGRAANPPRSTQFAQTISAAAAVICDEEALDRQ
jgi:hypothetical protein